MMRGSLTNVAKAFTAMIYNYVQRGRKIEQTSVYNVICATVQFTGSSAMAEGSRDALVCIEKSLQP